MWYVEWRVSVDAPWIRLRNPIIDESSKERTERDHKFINTNFGWEKYRIVSDTDS